MRAMRPQPFESFCASELGALLVWWLLFRAVTGRHALTLASGSVYIRPRWLPLSVLQSLHSRHKNSFRHGDCCAHARHAGAVELPGSLRVCARHIRVPPRRVLCLQSPWRISVALHLVGMVAS